MAKSRQVCQITQIVAVRVYRSCHPWMVSKMRNYIQSVDAERLKVLYAGCIHINRALSQTSKRGMIAECFDSRTLVHCLHDVSS